MKMIYVDSDFKCHVIDDGTMTAIETDCFDGKCDTYIEGYCYEDTGNGVAVYPWKDHDELEGTQVGHERQALLEFESALTEIETALGV